MNLPEEIKMIRRDAGECFDIEPAPDITIFDFINKNDESKMKTIFNKKRLKKFINRAYKCACEHGFHEEEMSYEHYLMLVCSEIGEAMEADRKGKKYDSPDYNVLERLMSQHKHGFCAGFSLWVKDYVGDELADVCIRLFDLCGLLGVTPDITNVDKSLMKQVIHVDSFCENCYELLKICCLRGDFGKKEVKGMTAVAIIFIEVMCSEYGIDLLKHIEWKMRYNEQRPKKHGKQY